MADDSNVGVSSRAERKAREKAKILQRERDRNRVQTVGRVLKKPEAERSAEEAAVLLLHADTVDELNRRQNRRNLLKRKREEVRPWTESPNGTGTYLDQTAAMFGARVHVRKALNDKSRFIFKSNKLKEYKSLWKETESEPQRTLCRTKVRTLHHHHHHGCISMVFDEADVLRNKVRQLALAVKEARHLVVYTGAGISTAAAIPDYRGPNGVWTLLQKGRSVSSLDLSEAEPTLTHMSLRTLHADKLVQHVVSQNCDGLHVRSGLPRHALSELHGNMFIEVCPSCSPLREFVRLFDVTEQTSLHRHGTGRRCCHCGSELRDTIVHFGERGTLEQPLNWKGAVEAAKMADTILCLGSSLKVLKKYACLWCMNRPSSRRPKLYIVNLQWTPKDDLAVLKIHGRCDDVMKLLMEELNLQIPEYIKAQDPIFSLATPLNTDEIGSHTRDVITLPDARHGDSTDGGERAASVSGGWFGRGYGKGRRKKKKAA